MLRHEDNPKYSDKVAARALELYDQDQAKWREQQSLASALSEMDVPAEYLERATVEVKRDLHTRRLGMTARWAAFFLVAAGSIGWMMTHRAARQAEMVAHGAISVSKPPQAVAGGPEPMVLRFVAPESAMFHKPIGPEVVNWFREYAHNAVGWTFRYNVPTEASIKTLSDANEHDYARVTIDVFSPGSLSSTADSHWGDTHPADRYWATVHTDGNKIVEGYHTITFRARATGLEKINLALVRLDTERWTTGLIPLSQDWRYYTFDLNSFYHQKLVSREWRTVGNGSPEHVPDQISNIAFLLGEQVNVVTAHGQVDIGDVVFQ